MKWADCYNQDYLTWCEVMAPSITKQKGVQHVIDWCRVHMSEGQFYFQYSTHSRWYFELERDALLFAMKWS